ncbi:DUF503 domain-containing protein [Candidatus Omnitrophota bacterium]
MVIGVLHIDLFLSNSQSLKEKRMVLKSLKTRVRNNFNVAVSELDHHEKWQKTSLGVLSISNKKRHMDTILSNVVEFINREGGAEIIEYSTELL